MVPLFFFMLFLFFFFFFKTGKFMVGPMSCEQQESRHTDWLFMWSHLCDLMGNNTKCLMLEFHWALCPFPTFSANQLSHSSSFPLALPPTTRPPPIQSPPSSPSSSSSSMVPSHGVITVADICHLS